MVFTDSTNSMRKKDPFALFKLFQSLEHRVSGGSEYEQTC